MTSFAVIGGSGLSELTGYQLVTECKIESPYGQPSMPVTELGNSKGLGFYFLGRHGHPHHIPPHRINYRANIDVLHGLGVRQIISVNAVGGINPAMPTGMLVIPDQIIDYSWGRAHTFFDGDKPVEHVDFSQPFDGALRAQLLAAVHDLKINCHNGGVYGVMQGPRLETAAEIDRLERDGCDVVGMTAMPEAALARELDIDYVSLCLVVNAAAGRATETILMADIQRVMAEGMTTIRSVLDNMVVAQG